MTKSVLYAKQQINVLHATSDKDTLSVMSNQSGNSKVTISIPSMVSSTITGDTLSSNSSAQEITKALENFTEGLTEGSWTDK